MISRTDEPMEGVVFDVQDHTWWTDTRGPGTHGKMISSDLHGAEEPIRWLLGWQRQDRVMTSPCMEKKKGGSPQLLRLSQPPAKPRGVVPNKYTKAFTLSTRKLNLGAYFFFKPLTI